MNDISTLFAGPFNGQNYLLSASTRAIESFVVLLLFLLRNFALVRVWPTVGFAIGFPAVRKPTPAHALIFGARTAIDLSAAKRHGTSTCGTITNNIPRTLQRPYLPNNLDSNRLPDFLFAFAKYIRINAVFA